MIRAVLDLLRETDVLTLALAVIIFDVPRYTFSLIAVSIAGFSRTTPQDDCRDMRWGAVVTVYNSGPAILQVLESLGAQTVPPHKIICVNDGSNDETSRILQLAYERNLCDRLIAHPLRCGTSMSINHAVRFLDVDYVLNVDSDTVLAPDAMRFMLPELRDPEIAGVSGNLLVRNHTQSLWTSLQSIEYLISITAGRRFMMLISALPSLSGAFMLFRRKAFMAIGGHNVGPGEDFEMSVRLRRAGYRLAFAENAFAWTSVPVSFMSLVRQRLRWDRDAFRIRIVTFGEMRLRSPFEAIGETLQRLDYLTFELFPSIAFPFYYAYLVMLFGPDALAFLFGLYLFLLLFEMLNIAVVLAFVPHRLTFYEIVSAFGFPLYQGVIMKIFRFWAFSQDDYVPPRIRAALYTPHA
jgi:cellulose synthase/poly-beta-1,6-N-acetylglucosamine synthase-like glycosyltransferase